MALGSKFKSSMFARFRNCRIKAVWLFTLYSDVI
jgi:hypothetical protein